eukprot:bmy_16382T0
MVTYVLLAYKRSELGGYIITLKPAPLANLTNSLPFLSILQSTANPKQPSFSELAIPTFNSYSENSQSSSTENQWPEGDQELGRKSSSTTKVPANPLPGWRRPPQHSSRPGPVVSPCTNIPPAAVVEYTPDGTNLPRGYPAKKTPSTLGSSDRCLATTVCLKVQQPGASGKVKVLHLHLHLCQPERTGLKLKAEGTSGSPGSDINKKAHWDVKRAPCTLHGVGDRSDTARKQLRGELSCCGYTAHPREDFVRWKVEVCNLPGLHSWGSNKRISGTSMAFESIVSKLTGSSKDCRGATRETRGEDPGWSCRCTWVNF